MKIGIVLSNPPKISETFLNSFITILSEQHDVTLFLGEKSILHKKIKQRIYFSKKNICVQSFKYFIKIFCSFNLLVKLRKIIPVKLIIHDIPILTDNSFEYVHFAFGNLAIGRERYGEILGCKLSVSFRGSDINVFPTRHNITYHNLLESVNKIHCNSEDLKSQLLKQNSIVVEKIHIIYPGLQDEFRIDEDDFSQILKKRQNGSILKIVSIGRLHWIKCIELTLATLAELKKKNVKFIFKIIGSGPEYEKLIYLRDFYNLNLEVQITGSLNSKEIKKELETANLYIQTSLAEGFSNSTMEAQALGLPVIVTPVSGMSELILHERTGYISSTHTIEDILKGFRWYLNLSPDMEREVAILARNNILKNFTMDQLQKKWLSYFN